MVENGLLGAQQGLQSLMGRLMGGSCAGADCEVQPPASETAPARQPSAKDLFFSQEGPSVAEEFEALVYSAQMAKVSLSAQFQEAAARVDQGDEGGAVQLQSRQMTFDFMAEMRSEELVQFAQRTGGVAGRMDGPRRETYIEASRQVAARFSMSIDVSSTVLTGFSNASEGLPEADDAAFSDFNQFVKDALAQVDEVLNEIFALLDDFFSSEGSLEARFNEFLEGLDQLGLMNFAPDTPALSGAGQGGAVQMQSQQFSIQLEFEFVSEEMVTVKQGEVQESDPVILDLDGDGYELTSHRGGARFDITGSGEAVSTAFVTGGDAFLAVDRNGNGAIDSGKELFGDQNGAANGFEELRKFDSNQDGRINARDRDFDQLRLFKDNGNGITEDGELISLADAGVEEISLAYKDVNQVAAGGNRLAQIASFTRDDGTRGGAADAILNFTA